MNKKEYRFLIYDYEAKKDTFFKMQNLADEGIELKGLNLLDGELKFIRKKLNNEKWNKKFLRKTNQVKN